MPENFEKLLHHDNVEVRIQAVKDLREREPDTSRAVPLLMKGLEDEDWRVRKTVADIFLDIGGEQVIKALIPGIYREDSANARNSAIEVLTAMGSEATDHLIDEYQRAEDNADVKKFIIDILGNTGDMKGLPLLLKALEDKDENVRASAVEYLGSIRGNTSVIKALIGILESEDTWVAYPAAEALGRIGDAAAVDALVSALKQKALRKPVIKALASIADPGTFHLVVPFLNDKSKTIREEAVNAVELFFKNGLSEETIAEKLKEVLGAGAPNVLLPHTRSKTKDIRIAAILLLGLLKDKKVIPRLLEIAMEEDVHDIVVKALVFIGRSLPRSLLPFFRVSDAYQRRIICEVAGKVGDSAFFKHLVESLKDEDGHVRGNAAAALSNMNNSEAIPHIKPLLLDEYENIQEETIKSLAKLKKWLDQNEIIKGLSDENHILKKNTASLLGLIGDKGALEALGRALKDSHVTVRVSVVEAIGAIGGAEAVQYLILALSDESPEVRRVAAIAIGRMRADAGIEPLIILLKDPDVWVRASAAEALGNIGDSKAIEPLIQLLTDESGFVKAVDIEALGKFKTERVKKILLQLLNDMDAEIRSTAVGALANFSGIAQDIIPLLKSREWSVRKTVIEVLGTHFRAESMAYIKEVANTDEDPQVRETAARYL
ncbi:phycocyanobilin lyase subunit alpha [bacterium BMS3Bbin08]|nr:phycocyanobilin lyase subunit alpha [bacterium BMS3Bbin08]HDH51476.1 HEAT repeat domain-containing protein [Nitrospirota bacterium]